MYLSEGMEDVGARHRDGHVHMVDYEQWLLHSGVGEVGQIVSQIQQQAQWIALRGRGRERERRGRVTSRPLCELLPASPHSPQSI